MHEQSFYKGTDDAPPPQPTERPVSLALNFVTPRGARLIKEHIAAIEDKLSAEPDPAIRLELRRDLRYWLARQSSMQIVEPNRDNTTVGFGSQVTLRRGTSLVTLTIVGEDESDPRAGLISWTAPLARAIDGAKVGEKVDLEIGQDQTVTILAISDNAIKERSDTMATTPQPNPIPSPQPSPFPGPLLNPPDPLPRS